MKPGKVERYINEKIERDGGVLFILIDPLDHPSPDRAVEVGESAYAAGVDVILIGGSMGVQGQVLDEVTKRIKEKVDVPIVLFPGNIATITQHADAIYFMSLLNSRNPYWISEAQTLAAPSLKKMGVEPLPTGYIVVEPGGTVGWVGDAKLVPRNKPQIGAALALAGEYIGCRLILTDVGSASELGHVPLEMVKAVGDAITVPYIVAGGIRTPKEAANVISAGADAVHVGTAFENIANAKKTISAFSKAVKAAGAKKR